MERQSSLLPSAATVREVLRCIEGTDIECLELTWGDSRISVTQIETMAPRTTDAVQVEVETLSTVPVVAPLTGVYYERSAPDREVFVATGDTVVAGQTVALIETMKLFNEVVCEVDGEVSEILVADGDLVEKNQILMRMQPQERTE